MLPDEKIMCHRTGFEKRCFDMVVHCKCRAWVKVQGADPQTGEILDQFDCADHWAPTLQMEAIKVARQTFATLHELRNEVALSRDHALVSTLGRLNDKIDDARANGVPKLIGTVPQGAT